MFISYAQNAEDVILWRALSDVPAGYYIDIGAFDPEQDSVTKAFYDRGWSGLNIEPAAEYHQKLVEQRPRDICLDVGIGDCAGIMPYYQFPTAAGWATFDADLVARHRQSGLAVVSRRVPVLTLNDVCQTLVTGEIHFLKIDAEGMELPILRGVDLHRYRPWVIVIEAIAPDTHAATYQDWEGILLDQGYEFVYFDGINRYYLAKEHAERRIHFSAPPNCLDRYVRQYEVCLEAGLAERHAQLQEALANGRVLETQLQEARAYGDALETQLQEARAYGRALETQLQEARAYGGALETQLREAHANGRMLETQLREAHASGRMLETQLREAHASGRMLEISRAELTVQLEEAWASRLSLEAGLTAAREALASKEMARGALERTAAALRLDLDQSHAGARALDLRLSDLEGHLERVRYDNKELRRTIDEIRASTSWMVTKPLRGVRRTINGIAEALARALINWVSSRPPPNGVPPGDAVPVAVPPSDTVPLAPVPSAPSQGTGAPDAAAGPISGFGARLRQELGRRNSCGEPA